MKSNHLLPAIAIILILTGSIAHAGPILIDHHAPASFSSIPDTIFQKIRHNFEFFYGHTSHGGQIMTGIEMLDNEHDEMYDSPVFQEISDDLGHNGDISWVEPTRQWLSNNPETNAVMWSWCGGASDNSEAGINAYLQAMNQLESEFPEVFFIYMTGHLDGTGPEGNLYSRNNQIREYCSTNDKILYDFADIESWDPAGTYYPNESDNCTWCTTWCSGHDCPGSCGGCAHSHCFNCYQKGKAFWWMMAQIAGHEITAVDSVSFDRIKSCYRNTGR
ncbi:MAG: hypothetical protein GY780_04710 [bacterium]|nr:hypothetical protein [bacterium]